MTAARRFVSPASHSGKTLIELVIVIGFMGILAAAAISMLSTGRSQIAVEVAAKHVGRDLELVRSRASSTHRAHAVAFDSTGTRYVVLESSGDTLIHPVTYAPFVVSLAELCPGVDLRLTNPAFGASDSLWFEAGGVPRAGGTVMLAGADTTWRVSVAERTGRIRVEAN